MDTGPWHILLIEDNLEDRADMRQMLLRGGSRRYRFSEASFGAEGVRKTLESEHGPVDCVLLDYALPDMDALEVLAALRNGADLPPCPVVVITGAAVEEGQPLLRAGAQDFIGKRWTSADSLTRAVENAVDRYKLQAERRRIENALRVSEEHHRALFNSIDAGYAVAEVWFDDSGAASDLLYLQVNPAFALQTGLANAEGRTLRAMVPGIEASWLDAFGAVALTGLPVRLEQFSAAMQRWFDVYAFQIGEPSARQVAVLFTDTTERKANEHALMAARAAAEAANRAKSDFLLHMSHELRSPLSSILGFTQLIENGTPPPTPAQRDSVQQILQAGWYLLGLINEVLDLTAIESGHTTVTSRAVCLAEVLDDCQALIGPQALQSGIEISFPVVERPCLVQADPVRAKQVLINLLTNAIKYNRVGGRVNVRCTVAGGQRVRVSVEDTGQGLARDQLKQLFQPFNRLGQELGTEAGMGVGLVICKRLVERMGGRIGADSTVGVGSAFWFDLEAAIQDTPSARVPAVAQVRSVLCIELASTCLQHLEDLVAVRPGTHLLRAGDVASGLALARSARPDAILMAPQLRDAAGDDARALLAKDPATEHIPIIALGADGASDPVDAIRPCSWVGPLSQPLHRAAFIEALDLAFQPQHPQGPTALV